MLLRSTKRKSCIKILISGVQSLIEHFDIFMVVVLKFYLSNKNVSPHTYVHKMYTSVYHIYYGSVCISRYHMYIFHMYDILYHILCLFCFVILM